MTILRLPLPMRRAPHHDPLPLRIRGGFESVGGNEALVRSTTFGFRRGRDVLRCRCCDGGAVAWRDPVAAMVLAVSRRRAGTAIAEPKGAGLFCDRSRTLGNGLFAARFFENDARDDAELQDRPRRYRRHRRLHPLAKAETIGRVAHAQLTESGAKTSVRPRLQKESLVNLPLSEGGRPASFARRPVLRLSCER
jgi:hypothetical protein